MGKLLQMMGLVAALLLTGCGIQPGIREVLPAMESVEQAVSSGVEFPLTLPDGVVAEQLVSYSGQYWEDGSGEQVENVAALTVFNPTEQMLSFGAFAVEQNGRQIYFFVHRLPPKSRCLILAYDRAECDPEQATACRELRILWEAQEFSKEQVDYVCLGENVTVINRDARTLGQVTVWYKRYDNAGECYIGGIAYAAYLYAMPPQAQKTVKAEAYDAATCRIVGIETKT